MFKQIVKASLAAAELLDERIGLTEEAIADLAKNVVPTEAVRAASV
jgi:hypothetical protein